MTTYKLGIIGYGGMGSWHAENIRDRIPRISVAGVYDIAADRIKQAKIDGFKVFPSAEELLNSGIDIAVIAVPNNYHKEYSILALKSGVAVVCEKPVCMTLSELNEIINVSKSTGKLFTVHHNRRWDIDFAVVKHIIDSNAIGKPYFIDSRLFGSRGLPGDWRSCPEAGGGMLYDWSIHLIDQILMLIDSKPKSVYCQALKITHREVDDCNKIMLTFENGVRAQIVVDTWCYIGENRWHISADDGTLTMTDWLTAKGSMVKANREIDWRESIILTPTGRTRTMAPLPKEKIVKLPLPELTQPRWEEFYENIIECIEGKAAPTVTHEQLIKSMKVLEACFESAKHDKVIIMEV